MPEHESIVAESEEELELVVRWRRRGGNDGR
jgi:hypothetical protein